MKRMGSSSHDLEVRWKHSGVQSMPSLLYTSNYFLAITGTCHMGKEQQPPCMMINCPKWLLFLLGMDGMLLWKQQMTLTCLISSWMIWMQRMSSRPSSCLPSPKVPPLPPLSDFCLSETCDMDPDLDAKHFLTWVLLFHEMLSSPLWPSLLLFGGSLVWEKNHLFLLFLRVL